MNTSLHESPLPTDCGVLRIDLLRNGPATEFYSLLFHLDDAFNHLFALEIIVTEARRAADEEPSSKRRVRTLRKIAKPTEVVLGTERLYLYRIKVQSPGWLDVIGKLNILETLRQYLNDRHERRKDLSYRNEAESKRLHLENEKRRLENEQLKTDAAEGRVRLLRGLGVPDDKIRQAITQHVIHPLEPLARAQDGGLVGGARMLSAEEKIG